MGQYFVAINQDKKQYICPWCIGGGAKLWEWAANPQGAIFTLLLRQSNEGGGGDYDGDDSLVGSWANDRLALVGDYDESNLYQEARQSYENISGPIARAFNKFIEIDEKKLEPETCSSCKDNA